MWADDTLRDAGPALLQGNTDNAALISAYESCIKTVLVPHLLEGDGLNGRTPSEWMVRCVSETGKK